MRNYCYAAYLKDNAVTGEEYPGRPLQHETETLSGRIFESILPARWIVRQLTERDYGIDCQLEFSRSDGMVGGEFAGIQLKGSHAIKMNNSGRALLAGINNSTYSYWLSYSAPVLIVFVDTTARRVYFRSVEDDYRRRFVELNSARTDKISVYFSESDCFSSASFIIAYSSALRLRRMDHQLPYVVPTYDRLVKLFTSRYRRNETMPVDGDGSYEAMNLQRHQYERELRTLYDDTVRIVELLDLDWYIPSVEEVMRKKRWGEHGDGEMIEFQFTAILDLLDAQFIDIHRRVRAELEPYIGYWTIRCPALVAFKNREIIAMSKMYWEDREAFFKLRSFGSSY